MLVIIVFSRRKLHLWGIVAFKNYKLENKTCKLKSIRLHCSEMPKFQMLSFVLLCKISFKVIGYILDLSFCPISYLLQAIEYISSTSLYKKWMFLRLTIPPKKRNPVHFINWPTTWWALIVLHVRCNRHLEHF